MEFAAVLSSFHGAMLTVHPGHCFTENPAMVTIDRISLKTASFSGVLFAAQALKSIPAKRTSFQPYVKASDTSSSVTFDASSSGKTLQGTLENKHNQKHTFPSGFEALVLDVCDETNIAELKVKVFENVRGMPICRTCVQEELKDSADLRQIRTEVMRILLLHG